MATGPGRLRRRALPGSPTWKMSRRGDSERVACPVTAALATARTILDHLDSSHQRNAIHEVAAAACGAGCVRRGEPPVLQRVGRTPRTPLRPALRPRSQVIADGRGAHRLSSDRTMHATRKSGRLINVLPGARLSATAWDLRRPVPANASGLASLCDPCKESKRQHAFTSRRCATDPYGFSRPKAR